MKTIIVVSVLVSAVALVGAVTRADTSYLLPPASYLAEDIALYERRAREDPQSAADRATLSMLYLQRAREAGDYADFRRAERAARAALMLREDRNRKALLGLASSLLAQHRFVEAREAARALVADDTSNVGSRSLYAEILFELGDYETADREFQSLAAHDENLAVAPRYARWLELHGRTAEARVVLLRAAAAAKARSDLPREQVAWFYLRLADFHARNDRLREAARHARTGLAVRPGDPRLIAVQVRIAAQQRDWTEALELARTIREQADIATLGLAGDAAAALGMETEARAWLAAAEAAYRQNPEPFARQWTELAVNHRLYPAETVRLLEQELQVRPDVFGHQLLARAYERLGRHAAADSVLNAAWTHFRVPHR